MPPEVGEDGRPSVSKSQGVSDAPIAQLDASRQAVRAATNMTAADRATIAANQSAIGADLDKLKASAPAAIPTADASTMTATSMPADAVPHDHAPPMAAIATNDPTKGLPPVAAPPVTDPTTTAVATAPATTPTDATNAATTAALVAATPAPVAPPVPVAATSANPSHAVPGHAANQARGHHAQPAPTNGHQAGQAISQAHPGLRGGPGRMLRGRRG